MPKRTTKFRTPRAKASPAKLRAKAYLRALAKSKWAYHLEDDPVEMFGKAEGAQLKRETTRAFKALGVEGAWDYYGKQMVKAGRMPKG
jgi:hypothetical protein